MKTEKDPFDELFRDLSEDLRDGQDLPAGHEFRFKHKLYGNKGSKVIYLKFSMSVAAAVALIIIAVMMWQGTFFGAGQQELYSAGESTEMDKIEAYYTRQIDQRLATLEGDSAHEAEYREFLNELTVLEEEYQSLKTYLAQSPNDDRVVEAMILNFRSRIEVLDSLQGFINRLNINGRPIIVPEDDIF